MYTQHLQDKMCYQFLSLTFALVFTLRIGIVCSGDIDMVLLEDKCDTDSMAITRYANTQLTLKTNVTVTTFCEKEAVMLEQLFSDKNEDVFIGALDYGYNALIMKYAELNQKPLISPFGTPRHIFHKQEFIFSLGSSFESIAGALRTALDYFRWKYIYMLVEVEENRINLATTMFVELSHNGFEPRIIYLTNISSDEALREHLQEIQATHKGSNFVLDVRFIRTVSVQFFQATRIRLYDMLYRKHPVELNKQGCCW